MNPVFRAQRVEGCLRVMVAEDNGLIAMDIEQTLVASFAAIVLVAHTLEQALALLDADPPDVAIVNSDLGGRSVAPLAGRLVSCGAPFVVLSAMAPRALVELAGGLFLQKPHGPDELVEAVARALGLVARQP